MTIEIVNKKQFIFVIAVAGALLAGLIFFGLNFFRKNGQTDQEELQQVVVFEAMIQTKGQDKYENQEDQKTFFENGDVMVIFPKGHLWTDSEKGELILKLKITADQARQLMEPKQEESNPNNTSSEKQPGVKRLRKYRTSLHKLGYDPGKSNEEQNFLDRIFDEKIIEEKQ